MHVCNAQNVLKVQGQTEILHGNLKFARFLCIFNMVYLGIVSAEKQQCLLLKKKKKKKYLNHTHLFLYVAETIVVVFFTAATKKKPVGLD